MKRLPCESTASPAARPPKRPTGMAKIERVCADAADGATSIAAATARPNTVLSMQLRRGLEFLRLILIPELLLAARASKNAAPPGRWRIRHRWLPGNRPAALKH